MIPSSTAYLLLAHGSRDARSAAALNQLTNACGAKLKLFNTATLIGTAYLELAELPIVEQLVLFANQAIQQNCQRVRVLPLFLAPGVHVLEDLPKAIYQAQIQLSDRSQLELLTYLGANAELRKILQYQSQQLPAHQIFLAHGSPQAAAQKFLLTIAASLPATPAYWSVNPHLPEQVGNLAAQDPTEIGILPYFLFPGRISAAISVVINELQSLFPDIRFRFTQGELEASLLYRDPQLIDLLVQVLLNTN